MGKEATEDEIFDAQFIMGTCPDYDGSQCTAPYPHVKHEVCKNCYLCNREED